MKFQPSKGRPDVLFVFLTFQHGPQEGIPILITGPHLYPARPRRHHQPETNGTRGTYTNPTGPTTGGPPLIIKPRKWNHFARTFGAISAQLLDQLLNNFWSETEPTLDQIWNDFWSTNHANLDSRSATDWPNTRHEEAQAAIQKP